MEDPADDLDSLIGELNSRMPLSPSHDTTTTTDFERWIAHVVRSRGSDLLLATGSPPMMRLHGSLTPLTDRRLASEEIESLILPLLDRKSVEEYRAKGIADASLRSGVGRFRINLHHERRKAAVAIRVLPTRVPTLAELNLPPEFEQLTRLTSGLVLIGGATGSGKTTTMAALIDTINRRESKHIITVEDPIEYEHSNASSLIEQVEIGIDAPDFATALRAAVRQAPDVLAIGEMRDPESMRIALSAAETGHLVLSSVHTMDVASTVGRICDSFPNERQNTIRQELSHALSAVVTQFLIPRIPTGRVPAAELLIVGYGARQHIRKNALQHLHQEITITRKLGSLTLEESLAGLVRSGLISHEEATVRSRHPEELENLIRKRSVEGI